MKNYIGFIRDHSASMFSLRRPAANDYNAQIASVQENAVKYNLDTIVSVVECGGGYRPVITNSSVATLKQLSPDDYKASGANTPLFDSVGFLISQFEKLPDAQSPDVSFMIMAITDGEENASQTWLSRQLEAKIKQLQTTDRWTFVFRVPHGYGRSLQNLGIAEGNILEWEQTSQGFTRATQVTASSYDNYYSGLTRGITSTKRFFTNIDTQKMKKDIQKLDDISGMVMIRDVSRRTMIQPFVEDILQQPYVKGCAYYQLNKSEKVQPQKHIMILDKKKGRVYAGRQARDVLGLPYMENVKLSPGYHGDYDIFIQSTSVNRILNPGSRLIYWPTNT